MDKRVDINKFTMIPVKDLILADWNYKTEDDGLKEKLKAQIQRTGMIINIVVRELEAGLYEVVNGNHRVVALQELGVEKVLAHNLGKVELWQGQKIAIETNETNFEANTQELLRVMSDLEDSFTIHELAETMPYSEEEIEGMKKAVENFVFKDLDPELLDTITPPKKGDQPEKPSKGVDPTPAGGRTEEDTAIIGIEDVFLRLGLTSIRAENYDSIVARVKDLYEQEEYCTEEDFLKLLITRGER